MVYMIKYVLLNDVSYLLHKRKNILILLFLPILAIILNSTANVSGIEIFNLSMGTNVSLDNYNVMEILVYVFTICFNVFLIVDVYIKDIEYQLEFIFLRTNAVKWFCKKSFVFMVMIFVIRLIQYLLAITVLTLNGHQILLDYLYLFIADYIYIILLQYLFLTLYMIGNTLGYNKFLMIGIYLIIFSFIPKSIMMMEQYIYLVIGIIVFLILINIFIIRKFNKRIIQNL